MTTKIKMIVPAQPNWFVLRSLGSEERLSRIVCWAVVEEDEKWGDETRAITSNGHFVDRNDEEDELYVWGDDKAPNGQTWRAVYEGELAVNPRASEARRVEHVFEKERLEPDPLLNKTAYRRRRG